MRSMLRPSDPASGNVRNSVPMYLNVYDLTPINNYLYWFGLGIFHSGVEAHGIEYAFGAHDQPSSGVFEVEPHNCPGFSFRTSILVGTTDMSPQEFRTFIENCADDYNGDTYHLIIKNCNHFTNDVCYRLTGKDIPSWVNRLARIGWFCNCLLPKDLQVPTAGDPEEHIGYEGQEQELKHSLGPSLWSLSRRKSFQISIQDHVEKAVKPGLESSRSMDNSENENDEQHLLRTRVDESDREYLQGNSFKRFLDPENAISSR